MTEVSNLLGVSIRPGDKVTTMVSRQYSSKGSISASSKIFSADGAIYWLFQSLSPMKSILLEIIVSSVFRVTDRPGSLAESYMVKRASDCKRSLSQARTKDAKK